MKTLYAVSSGSYSDYGIDAIFDSKELAQAFIDAFTTENGYKDFNDIEEWELNPFQVHLKKGRKAYEVTMLKDGTVREVERTNRTYKFSSSAISFNADKTVMFVNCFATDEKHAIKIANEKRTQHIALGTWGIN